jgi:hypothetical protein
MVHDGLLRVYGLQSGLKNLQGVFAHLFNI